MANKIGWTDETWSPVTGCTHSGSPGCDNCWAKRMARRLAGRYGYPEAPHHFDVTLRPDRLDQPHFWHRSRRIFVCSMSDLFHDDVPFSFIDRVFNTMEVEPEHTFQILTKRPQRLVEFCEWRNESLPDHIWFGVTVESNDYLWRIDELNRMYIPGICFVSAEPLLGEMYIRPQLFDVDLVIAGGETGPGARPMHPEWARSLRDQCTATGTPFFFKSWGAWKPGETKSEPFGPVKVGERCIEHNGKYTRMHRVGAKQAGRELDGRLWEQMPT